MIDNLNDKIIRRIVNSIFKVKKNRTLKKTIIAIRDVANEKEFDNKRLSFVISNSKTNIILVNFQDKNKTFVQALKKQFRINQ